MNRGLNFLLGRCLTESQIQLFQRRDTCGKPEEMFIEKKQLNDMNSNLETVIISV